MLVGMNMSNRSKTRRTSVYVRKVDEGVGGGAAAGRRGAGEPALVKVNRARVQIGYIAIRDGAQFQVVKSIFGPAAAKRVSTVCDAVVVELVPAGATVF